MYCPNCGQQQLSDNTRFCSRCGISISGLAEWLAGGGELAVRDEENATMISASPRRKGIRRGVKFMFLSGVLVPVFFFFSLLIEAPIPLLIPLTVFLIGLFLMLYARLFGEETSHGKSHQSQPSSLGTMFGSSALPPASNNMTNRVAGQQVRTSDLVEPPSVTEHTTKLLENDQR
jgi:endogenous inhibitor of DNA gyrase (YacG/DUF329 family)